MTLRIIIAMVLLVVLIYLGITYYESYQRLLDANEDVSVAAKELTNAVKESAEEERFYESYNCVKINSETYGCPIGTPTFVP